MFVVYMEATGEIKRSGGCPDEDIPLQAIFEGEAAISGDGDGQTHYVEDGVVLMRPWYVVSDSTAAVDELLTFTGLPANTTVTIDEETVELITDGVLEISFPIEGAWVLKFSPPFPWLETSCEVIVA